MSAAIITKKLSNFYKHFIFSNHPSHSLQWLLQTRNSMYQPYYINPVYKLEELEKLKAKGQLEDRAFVPIKAAKNDENSSSFHDPLVNKFINVVMSHGKKQLARNLIEKTFENVKRIQLEKYHRAKPEEKTKIECNPFQIFHIAIQNSKPVIMLTPIKRGGTVYQVPVPVSENQSRFRAMKWLKEAAQDKHRKVHFPEKLAQELIDAANNEGRVVKKKHDLHKQCEANRAYAHFRWN